MHKLLIILLSSYLFSACTVNIIMTQTEGYASDIVDDTNEDSFDPQLSIPVKGL